MRKNLQPELKFTAHKQLVLSIDWHPLQGNLLASGGRDRYVKVWDLSDLKQPRQTIQTIASVGRVAWRPNCDDHIATSASLMDNSIHVWDTHRPFIPIASMKGHMDIASGISWLDTPMAMDGGGNATHNDSISGGNGVAPNNGDGIGGSDNSSLTSSAGEWEGRNYWQHMLACSKDGTLKLHSLAHSFKHYEALPTSALALNSKGRVAFSHDFVGTSTMSELPNNVSNHLCICTDRDCYSLKIHRNITSSTGMLFHVEDMAATGMSHSSLPSPMSMRRVSGSTLTGGDNDRASIDSGGTPDPFSAKCSNGNGTDATLGVTRTSSRKALAQTPPLTPHQTPHPPPLPPRALGRVGASSNSLSAHSPQLNAAHTPYQHSSSMSSITTASTTSSVDSLSRHATSVGAALRGSPVLTPQCADEIGIPQALISILSLQSVVTAGQLEKILHGDKDEYVLVSEKVEAMRAEFEHGRHLSVSFGFDEHAFRFLASNYKLFPSEGVTFGQMCAHNALAAFVTGNTHLCQMWRILEVLCADEGGIAEAEAAAAAALDSSTTSQRRRQHRNTASFDHSTIYSEHNLNHLPHGRRGSRHHRDTSFGGIQDFSTDEDMEYDGGDGAGNQTAMLLEQLDFVNPQAMEGFDPFPYDPTSSHPGQDDSASGRTVTGTGVNGGASTAIVNGTAVYGNLSHLRHSVLKELLEYYVDIGDLQSCVTIAVVVGAVVNVEQVMGKAWVQQTLMHYIDLLHQLQIYTAANDLVRNCSDPSIRQMNMVRTGQVTESQDNCISNSFFHSRNPQAFTSIVLNATSHSSRLQPRLAPPLLQCSAPVATI